MNQILFGITIMMVLLPLVRLAAWCTAIAVDAMREKGK